MRNWEIRARNRNCSGCQTQFQVGQVYHCLLDFGGDEPEREDFCQRCWKEKNLAGRKQGRDRAYWRAAFKKLYQPVEDERIKKDVAQRLFEKYIASDQPEHINFCYILALLQERKKIYIPRKHTRDQQGNEVVIYEQRDTGETYIVRDPGLTVGEAEEVQVQIRQLLEEEKPDAEKVADEKDSEVNNRDGDRDTDPESSSRPLNKT